MNKVFGSIVLVFMIILTIVAFWYPSESQAVAAILTFGTVLHQLCQTQSELKSSKRFTESLLTQLARDSEISAIGSKLHAYFEMRELSRVCGGTNPETQTQESDIARNEIPILIERLSKLSSSQKDDA